LPFNVSHTQQWHQCNGLLHECTIIISIVHKHYIEHLSNFCYFILRNYIAIIIGIVLSPSPIDNCKISLVFGYDLNFSIVTTLVVSKIYQYCWSSLQFIQTYVDRYTSWRS